MSPLLVATAVYFYCISHSLVLKGTVILSIHVSHNCAITGLKNSMLFSEIDSEITV